MHKKTIEEMHEILNVKHLVFVGLCSDHFLILFCFWAMHFELHGFLCFCTYFWWHIGVHFWRFTLFVMLQVYCMKIHNTGF